MPSFGFLVYFLYDSGWCNCLIPGILIIRILWPQMLLSVVLITLIPLCFLKVVLQKSTSQQYSWGSKTDSDSEITVT